MDGEKISQCLRRRASRSQSAGVKQREENQALKSRVAKILQWYPIRKRCLSLSRDFVCLYALILIFSFFTFAVNIGRDISVDIATRYGMDGPGIESRCGARFSAPDQTGPESYPASCTMGTRSLPGVKQPGRGADHPPPSKCRGQERVGLYLYSQYGSSWPVIE